MRPAARRAPKTIKLKAVLFLLILIGVLMAALPTAIVFAVGMVPTIVALIVDLTAGRHLTRCVAGLNIAGVAPFIDKLWTNGNDLASAIAIVTDPFAWLVIYGASSIGWLLFLGFPGMVAVYQTLNAKRRVYVLKDKRRALLEEWGDSIKSPANAAKDGARRKAAAAASAQASGEAGTRPSAKTGGTAA